MVVQHFLFQEPTDEDYEPQRHIQISNHIKYLPPSLYKWICNELNVHYASGQNWKLLAGRFMSPLTLPPTCQCSLHIQIYNHIKHLPPSLYTWICNELNVHYASKQNWKLLAARFLYATYIVSHSHYDTDVSVCAWGQNWEKNAGR